MSSSNIEDVLQRAREEAQELASWAETMRGMVDVLPLSTPQDEERAVALAKKMREAKAKAEAKRKELKEPFASASTKIDELFRGPRRDLETLESTLRQRLETLARERAERIREAQRKEREAREAAMEAARKAALAARPEEATHAAEARAAIEDVRKAKQEQAAIREEGPKGLSARITWHFEVTDLAKVPVGFLKIDEAAVRAYLAAQTTEEPEPVPGLRFYSKTSTVIR